MTSRFTAVVEQGRLRPVAPVELTEGATVDVWIMGQNAELPTDLSSAASILSAIAALPSEPVDPTTSVRHDEVLYSREAHP